MKSKKEWKRMCICVRPEEHREIRIGAAEMEISISDYIRTLIRAHLIEVGLKKGSIAKPS